MSEQVSTCQFPGKILFVDNEYDDVKEIIDKLILDGITVQYWNSIDNSNVNFDNVRIIVLDLKLSSAQGEDRTDPIYFQPAVDVLSKIRGPYLIVILSTDYEEGDIDRLKKAYAEFYPNLLPLQTLGEEIGISKSEITIFYEKIKKKFEEKNVLKLIIAWEKLLDIAKDKALYAISKEEFENEINVFVKSIKTDVGDGSLTREFVSNMTRLLSRYMNSGTEYDELTKILTNIAVNTDPQEISEPLLQHMRTFYKPTKDEKIWTGDIFKIPPSVNAEENFMKYRIILTPACDFSWNKAEHVQYCEGFALNRKELSQTDHPWYNLVTAYQLPEENSDNKINDKNFRESLEKSYKKDKQKIHSPRYYVLRNVKEEGVNEYFWLVFDFQKVSSLKKCTFETNHTERLFRADSPYIEDLLQKYGSYSTRLGIPGEKTI